MNKLIIIIVIDQKKLCTIHPHVAHKPVSRTCRAQSQIPSSII